METIVVHGEEFTIYQQGEMDKTKFGKDVLRFTKEGAALSAGANGFGLYLKKGKWYLYRSGFKREFSWDTLDEAISSCLILQKMEALP